MKQNRRQIKLMLSHIPLGTPIAVADSPAPEQPGLIGRYAGLGLAGDDDLINVRVTHLSSADRTGKVGIRLDDAVSITILLNDA